MGLPVDLKPDAEKTIGSVEKISFASGITGIGHPATAYEIIAAPYFRPIVNADGSLRDGPSTPFAFPIPFAETV